MRLWKEMITLLILSVIITVAIVVNAKPKSEHYPTTTVVISVDRTTDTVTVEDFTGNLWEFEGCEDWQVNDICSMIMSDNATEDIRDDEIISVRYSGWI